MVDKLRSGEKYISINNLLFSAIVTVAIIAMAGITSAQINPVIAQGTVTYQNGTGVPSGWNVTLENLYIDDALGPWYGTTGNYDPYNYTISGSAKGFPRDFRVTVESPDGAFIGANTTTVTASGSFVLNVVVFGAPSVIVLYPNGGEEIPMGTAIEVSAHAEDDTGVAAVWFNYSCDNGGTWIPIGAGNKVSGTFTDGVWNVSWTPEIPGNCTWSECLVRADAIDNEGKNATDTSDGTFSLVDRTKPIVINASATPSTIVMDTGFTELQVDVADTYNNISTVTVNLSPIGGNPATNMSNIGNYSAGGLTWTVYNYTTNSSVEGTFCLQVNATDICGNSNTSVCIPLEVIAGVPPTNLTAEWNQTDDTVNVSWDGTPEASYDVYLATNKTGPFNKVATVTGLSWIDVNATDDRLRLYRVNLTDMEANQNMTAGKFDITIPQGWSLFSLPLTPHNTSLSAIVCDIKAENGDWIYKYKPETQGWDYASYISDSWADWSTLTTLEPGNGYWYQRAGTTYNLTIAGEILLNISIPIPNGWSLVGYGSVAPSGLDIVNEPANDDWIYKYKPETQGWDYASYTGGAWADWSTLTTFEPGNGYWYQRAGGLFNWTYSDI